MSTAEWMAGYRQSIHDNEPQRYLDMLKKARQRARKARRLKHEQRLKELADDPVALRHYLKKRNAQMRAWQRPRMRQSRHRLYNDSIFALEEFG